MSIAVALQEKPLTNHNAPIPTLAPDTVRASVTRLRPYVPGKPIEEVKRDLGLAPDFPIIKLASNENVLGPSPAAIEAMRQAGPDVWLYPDDTCFELKNALSRHWDLTPEHFILGNGSDEILHFLMLALLEREDEVVFADPSFVQYKAAAMMADCHYTAVPLTLDMRHDLPAMRAAITERTKLVFVCNPNNPTGTIVTRDELEAFLADLPPRIIVVLDQAYYEYVEATDVYPEGLDYVRAGHNVLVLQTFSKAYALAGLRCGYGIARPEIIGYLQQVRGPFNVNTLGQVAAIASLSDPKQVAKAQAVNAAGKRQIGAACEAMGLRYIPTEANFILIDCGRDAAAVYLELMRRGVIVRSFAPAQLPTWVRVTIGTEEMNQRFISSLREVLAAA